MDNIAVARTIDRPRISVIVPIYNVEPYVRKCLDSLRNQSMKQIEIICINDGSTDESGTIADEYLSEEWPIFRVIHTENQGLSAARNHGIGEARAEWLMFVDSDDWVSDNFCRIPYEIAVEKNADLVIFSSYETTEKEKIKGNCGKRVNMNADVINHESALDYCGPVWDKLYSSRLFKDVRYPEGHVYEDLATTHRLICNSTRIVQLKAKLYYHRNREGSISHLLSNDRDRLAMSKRRYMDLVEFGYPEKKAYAKLISAALRCYGRAESEDIVSCHNAMQILETVKGIPKNLSKKEKIMLVVWQLNGNLYRKLYRLFLIGLKRRTGK